MNPWVLSRRNVLVFAVNRIEFSPFPPHTKEALDLAVIFSDDLFGQFSHL